jgi:hypothetical protein
MTFGDRVLTVFFDIDKCSFTNEKLYISYVCKTGDVLQLKFTHVKDKDSAVGIDYFVQPARKCLYLRTANFNSDSTPRNFNKCGRYHCLNTECHNGKYQKQSIEYSFESTLDHSSLLKIKTSQWQARKTRNSNRS